jgi:diadenosine tetraphosphate (Ap4A) HIT family hydrolase
MVPALLREIARSSMTKPTKGAKPARTEEKGCIFCERARSTETFRDLVIFENQDFLVSHQIGDDGTKTVGVLHFQTKRHVPSLGHLRPHESRQMGGLLASVSRALERVTGAPWTYCFGFTEGPRHVHLVLGARYAALPEAYWRLRFAEWPDAPRGDREKIEEFCATLRKEVAHHRLPS